MEQPLKFPPALSGFPHNDVAPAVGTYAPSDNTTNLIEALTSHFLTLHRRKLITRIIE